jgi:hypothetical protein
MEDYIIYNYNEMMHYTQTVKNITDTNFIQELMIGTHHMCNNQFNMSK